MKCYFCKRDENEIQEIFASLVTSLKNEASELDLQIENKKKQYPLDHGFIPENFEKVKKINENILKMKVSAFSGNLDAFLGLDPSLELLNAYLTKYQPEISPEKTLKDVMNLYIREPTEKRLYFVVSELASRRSRLLKTVKEIEDENKFSEVEISTNIPLTVFNFSEESMQKIAELMEILFDSEEKHTIKVTLCPYCSYLFHIYGKKKIESIKLKPRLNIIEDEDASQEKTNQVKKQGGDWYSDPQRGFR